MSEDEEERISGGEEIFVEAQETTGTEASRSNPAWMHARYCPTNCRARGLRTGISRVSVQDILLYRTMDLSASKLSSERSLPASSLDCRNGLNCADFECELRHLDLIEQQGRLHTASVGAAFHYSPDKPHLIITASRDMGRSASTWVFNAVRLLYRKARVACDSYWIRELSKQKLERRLQNSNGAHVLVKTHEWTATGDVSEEEFHNRLLPMFTRVIVSVRKGFSEDPAWLKVATHVIHYEDIVAENSDSNMNVGALSVLRALADHLGISPDLSDDDIREVDYELMTLPIPGDQSTKFWSFHSRRGGRPQPIRRRMQQTPSHPSRHVFVTRHGARLDNGPDRVCSWLQNSGHGRPQDTPLSAHGHQAASELATALVKLQQRHSIVLDHIVSSPFLRCIETANAVASLLRLSIKVEPGISEVGSKPSHMASQSELTLAFPLVDQDYTPVMSREQLPQSEYSDGAAARRAEMVAKTITSRLSGTILFVGHGASCLGLVHAFGAGGYVGYCSLTQFRWTASGGDDNGTWKLVGKVGDVSHLSDPQTALDSAW